MRKRRNPAFVCIGFGPPIDAASPAELGFKAYNLWRMTTLGLAVPPAFVLPTAWCRDYLKEPGILSAALVENVLAGIRLLEQETGLGFGSPRRPLLVSVRSGAPVSMPGMMETLLDIGLNDESVHGLIRLTGNPRLAWDSYARLVERYAIVVHRCRAERFAEIAARIVDERGAANRRELDFAGHAALVRAFIDAFEGETESLFPQEPRVQLETALRAVFESWLAPKAAEYRRLNGLDDALGTAVTVQRMVYGNAGGTSGAGVGFTRNPASGVRELYLDFRFNAQGEDIVAGTHDADDAALLGKLLPDVHAELDAVAEKLERAFGDVQEFEFTVHEGALHLLQTRTAKRTPWAALRIAVEQVAEGLITPKAALARLEGIDLASLRSVRLRPSAETPCLAHAIPAGVDAASGPIALDVAAARRFAAAGKPPILVRAECSTEDIAGFAVSAGILTATGGRTSHAAVVARQLGRVCLVGCQSLSVDLARRSCALGGSTLAEGSVITLDSATGSIYAGAVETADERPTAWLAEVERWRAAHG